MLTLLIDRFQIMFANRWTCLRVVPCRYALLY